MSSMDSQFYGNPGLPLPKVYIMAALSLIAEAGETLKTRGTVQPKMIENHITYLLEAEMRLVQKLGKSDMLIFNVRPNMPYITTNPLVRCEIDIKIQWPEYPSNPERYLTVEAKKLYGRGNSRAFDYIIGGVMDFVNSKYSSGHDFGIMLGYVVVAPLSKAVAAVKKSMDKRKVATHQTSPFLPDNSMCNHPNTHCSTHLPVSGAPTITLIHIFLDLC